MDYTSYAEDNFVRLLRHFDAIASILTIYLMDMQEFGFNMSNGYMFGFSFGGQLVTEVGRRIGPQTIKDIDSMIFYL